MIERLRQQIGLVRLPLVAALIVFVVAIASTHLALRLENREADRQTELLAKVYLDGLEAATREAVSLRDWQTVEGRFRAAFGSQEGVSEVLLLLLAPDLAPVARVSVADTIQPPPSIARGEARFVIDSAAGLAWTSRRVGGAAEYRVIAALDIQPMLAGRQRLALMIAVIDLMVASLCGLAAYVVLRHLNRPIEGLLALLRDSQGTPRPLPEAVVVRAGRTLQPVFIAFNAMVEGLRERERLKADIADRTKTAALGRLAATIAHEVRNPLGGLATAVTTLRKFGDRPDVRQESLEFLDRGIQSIDALVTRTLNLYRPEEERRLGPEDLRDLCLLVAPAATKREVTVEPAIDLPVAVDVAASGVRQVLLNLLLNAVAATPPGGQVCLQAWIETIEPGGPHLAVVVSDQGSGMDHAHIRRLVGDADSPAASRRLGIDTVVALLGDLQARASVQPSPRGGTAVRVDIPLEPTA
ncbi:MAG: sensor histidine kinase [Alphaproteobacteria bacterium]|nr:MAG: sensor histidine kinase [Alphaproteobacteria bacterium]